jgi:hypothetical protein
MVDASTVMRRVDSASARLDGIAARLEQQEAERLEAARAAQARADADHARENAERRRQIIDRYDPFFAAFGTQTPQPRDDESAYDYRRRLFTRLQRRLPDSSDLVGIRADELSGKPLSNFEVQLFTEVTREAEKPSASNLPPNGELVQRIVTDHNTGSKHIDWFGKESFIKQLSRPPQHVVRICDPRKGIVHWGERFERY